MGQSSLGDPIFFHIYDIVPRHAIGNAYADVLAGRAADRCQLDRRTADAFLSRTELAHVVQKRLLAILLHLVRTYPRSHASRPAAVVVQPPEISQLILRSMHRCVFSGRGVSCVAEIL